MGSLGEAVGGGEKSAEAARVWRKGKRLRGLSKGGKRRQEAWAGPGAAAPPAAGAVPAGRGQLHRAPPFRGLRGPARSVAALPAARLLPFLSASPWVGRYLPELRGPRVAAAGRLLLRALGARNRPGAGGTGTGRGTFCSPLSGGAEGLRQPGARRRAGERRWAGSSRQRRGKARSGRSCRLWGVGGRRAGAGRRLGRHLSRREPSVCPAAFGLCGKRSTAGRRLCAKAEAGRIAPSPKLVPPHPKRVLISLNVAARGRLPPPGGSSRCFGSCWA